MRRRRFRPRLSLFAPALAVLALSATARADEVRAVPPAAGEPVGLFTTLPLYWPETRGLSGLIGPGTEQPWFRTAIERVHPLVPLDVLGGEADTLSGLHDLLLAQPRALSPAENVALDAWVRDGGRLLLFADPMLTGESLFAIGDKRRPQDVALLSPILAHWGLELRFDESRPTGEEEAPLGDGVLPVNRPGTLVPRDGGEADCTLFADGLAANCAIGEGRAIIVADAALFDGKVTPTREAALASLLTRAFADR